MRVAKQGKLDYSKKNQSKFTAGRIHSYIVRNLLKCAKKTCVETTISFLFPFTSHWFKRDARFYSQPQSLAIVIQ